MVEVVKDQILLSNRNDVSYMRNAVLFEGPERGQRLSRFWVLLTLAAVIAAAGIVADSTARVIGAMIIAPMMLPIQGTMLATVLGDHVNLVRSILLVVAGASAAIAIGFLVGMFVANDVVAATNPQVAGRVNPGLVDLLAALATGVVGSIALVRRDISDTLPGVAIAISLVPPLVVSGLTLESGAYAQSLGALLLFVTNVAAILATGVVAMAFYKIHRAPVVVTEPGGVTVNERKAVVVIVAMLALVAIPLTVSSIDTGVERLHESTVRSVVGQWADDSGWDLMTIHTHLGQMTVRVTGPLPIPDTDELAGLIAESGVEPSLIEVELVPANTVKLKSQ